MDDVITYHITSALLCHDVRLNTSIAIDVELDHFPDEQEAIRLLCPEAERVVAKNFCEGCGYELYGVEVKPRCRSDGASLSNDPLLP